MSSANWSCPICHRHILTRGIYESVKQRKKCPGCKSILDVTFRHFERITYDAAAIEVQLIQEK
jgi:hypothetical protein